MSKFPSGELAAGDVVQLHPDMVQNKAFAGCFMTVTEPKDFGAVGYVQCIGTTRDDEGGMAYYRATFEEMSYIGAATWVKQL